MSYEIEGSKEKELSKFHRVEFIISTAMLIVCCIALFVDLPEFWSWRIILSLLTYASVWLMLSSWRIQSGIEPTYEKLKLAPWNLYLGILAGISYYIVYSFI